MAFRLGFGAIPASWRIGDSLPNGILSADLGALFVLPGQSL
tara:strand:- start:10 stop:132 length:123 start_codon:yes stop_codon:yes gene_type:complete